MASLMIHQAIGEEYCKKHNIRDVKSFLLGNLAPDLVKDKSITHFSKIRLGNKTYTESILNKINLPLSSKNLDITDDYQRGQFLHLVSDYVFFYQYLLNNPKYKEVEHLNQLFIRDLLYRDYYRINLWIMKNYPDLDLSQIPSNAQITRDDATEILSIPAISKLIDICSEAYLDTIHKFFSSPFTESELTL